MSQRRSLAVRMRIHARRFVRRTQPVRLGQTPLGLFLAVTLILLWGLERPAVAAVALTPTGSVENQFFVLEWSYDLDGGQGSLTFTPKPVILSPGSDPRYITLWNPYFEANSVFLADQGASTYVIGTPKMLDYDPADGSTRLKYPLCQRSPYDYHSISNTLDLHDEARLGFSFTGKSFPVASCMTSLIPGLSTKFCPVSSISIPLPVRLTTTELVFTPAFYDLSSYCAMFLPETSIEFVTVEAVPEPATLALAGLGAAAAAAGRRRTEEEPQADEK